MSACLCSASWALEALRPMQGHSAPPATSTAHQLVAQPRKVREGCVTTVFSHRMIARSWSTENGVSPGEGAGCGLLCRACACLAVRCCDEGRCPASFHRLGGFSGGVSLAEPPLPASSLTRNARNTTTGRSRPPRLGGETALPTAGITLHRALHDGRPGFPGADGRLPIRSRCGRVYD